jgi:hypothetical protein
LLTRRGQLIAAGTVLAFCLLLFIQRDHPPLAGELQAPLRHVMDAVAATSNAGNFEGETAEVSRLQQEAAIAVARQSRRVPLLRNYDDARRLLAEADTAALAAMETLTSESRIDHIEAAEKVAAAREALLQAREEASRARVQASGRRALVQQEIALEEAELNLERGAYAEAMEKAGRVLSASGSWHANATKTLARLQDEDALATWVQWVDQTVAWSARNRGTALVVDKAGHRLLIYDAGRLLTEFPVDLGLNPIPDKLHEGDNATPEGRYRVSEVRTGNATRYYQAFLLDYPNKEDWSRFREAQSDGRVASDVQIGGLIEIHGYGGRGEDWTNGCIALTNREMDFLDGWVIQGTPVTIVGSLPDPPKGPADRRAAASGAQP